jgi:hypothetical protein
MKAVKSFWVAFCLGAVLVALSPQAKANEWDKRSVITISQPLDVAGTILQPGKYVFRLVDSPVDRHIVRVFNGDETKVELTVLAIPDWRVTPTSTTQFGYWEMPAGQPISLKSWFYPGDLSGQQFPRPPLMPVAATTARTVPIPQPAPPAAQPPQQPQEQAEVTQPAQPQVTQPAQPQEQAQNEQPAPMPAPAPEEQPAKKLPKTASPYPLVGLMGLISLGGALGTRALKRMI